MKRFFNGRALVIGNDMYNYKTHLSKCCEDADLLGEALRQGQFPGQKTDVHKNVNRAEMFRLADKMFESLADGVDCTWFHFSGHGEAGDRKGHKELGFGPVDSERFEDNMQLSYIIDGLSAVLVPSPVLHIITLDCCQENKRGVCGYGGDSTSILTAIESILKRRKASGTQRGPIVQQDMVYKMFGRSRRSTLNHEFFIFTASAEGRTVEDTGIFSRAIVDFLKYENRGLSELKTRIPATVKLRTHGAQLPVSWDVGVTGDYLITRNSTKVYGKEASLALLAEASRSLHDLPEDEFQRLERAVLKEGRRRGRDRAMKIFSTRIRSWCPRAFVDCIIPATKHRWELIVFDGLIGCGKTTVLNMLQGSYHVAVRKEPIDDWWHLLVDLYNKLQRGEENAADELERTVWEHHRKIATNRSQHVLSERGLCATVKVFSKVLCERGLVSQGVRDELVGQYEALMKDATNSASISVYFKVSVGVAKQRIEKRADEENRFFEKGMPEDYLQSLYNEYEKIFRPESEDVIIVDADQPSTELVQEVKQKLASALRKKCATHDCELIMDRFSSLVPTV